jgi:hypothetical protein
VERERSLPILEGGEVLRLGRGDGFVARDDALDQPAHGFQAQRQRDHVEQQQVVAAERMARELVRLYGCAQRDDLVGVEVVERRTTEQLRHRALHLRHARGAADHDHALHFFGPQPGVAQGAAHRGEGALGEVRSGRLEVAALNVDLHVFARQTCAERCAF